MVFRQGVDVLVDDPGVSAAASSAGTPMAPGTPKAGVSSAGSGMGVFVVEDAVGEDGDGAFKWPDTSGALRWPDSGVEIVLEVLDEEEPDDRDAEGGEVRVVGVEVEVDGDCEDK